MTQLVFADSSVWKDDHGYSIYIPKYWKCDDNLFYDWNCKYGNGSLLTKFYYDVKFTDPDLFNEREVALAANQIFSIFPEELKFKEKKSSNWFGTITQEYKFETVEGQMNAKFIVKNDGYVYYVLVGNRKTPDNEREMSSILNSFRVLSKEEVKKTDEEDRLEKQRQKETSKKFESERNKQILEQDKKMKIEVAKEKAEINKMTCKQLEEKNTKNAYKFFSSHNLVKKLLKDCENKKTKLANEQIAEIARKKIQEWRDRSQNLDNRFTSLEDDVSSHSMISYVDLYNSFVKSVDKYEGAINNLKNPTKDKVDQIIRFNEEIVKRRYYDASSYLYKMEQSVEFKNRTD